MEEILKKLELKDETVEKILTAMKDNKLYITKEENIDERYKKLKKQKEELEKQLGDKETSTGELEEKAKGNEELQKQLEEYKSRVTLITKQSKEKIKNLTIDNALNNLLSKNRAKHTELLLSKFEKDKLVVKEDGTIEGLEEQFNEIKSNYKDLFEEKVVGTTPINNGVSSTQSKKDYFIEGFKKY